MNKDPPAIMGSSIPVNSSSIGRRRHSRSSVHNEVFSPKEAMHIRQVDNTQRYVVKTPSASFHGRDDFDVKPSSGGSSGRNNGHRTSKSFHGSVDGPTPPPLPPRRTSRSFHGHHQPQQQQHNRHCHVHPDIPLNTATEAQCPKCTVELMKIAARELESRANELERGMTTEAGQTTTKQHRHVKKDDAAAAAAANHSNGNGSKHSTGSNNNFNSTTPIEEDVERLTQINALLRWSSAFQHVTEEELRRKTKEELHQMAKEEFRKKSEARTNNSSGSKRNSRSNSRPIHRPSLTSEDRPQLGSLMKPKSWSPPSQHHQQQQQQRKSRQDQNNQNQHQKQHRPHQQQQQQQQQQLTPKYSIGQKARHPSHVQPTSTSREETLITIAQLKEGEGAFIRRSNNEWTYATLTSRERFGADACLVFMVNVRGATKSFPLTSWAKFVRLVAKTTNRKIENKKVEGETTRAVVEANDCFSLEKAEEEDDSELDLDLGGEKEEIDVMIHPTEEKGEVEEESVDVDEDSVEVEEESVDLFSTGSPNTESDYDEDDSFHAMELPGQKYNDVAEEKEIPSKDIIFDHNVSMYTLNPDLGNSVPSILHSTNHRKKCAPTNHIAFHRSSSNTSESTARSSSPLSSYFGDDDKEDNSRKNLNSSSERMFRRSLQDETKGENLNLSFEQLFRKSLQGTSDTAAFSSSDKMEDKNNSDDTDQEESAPRSRRKGRPILNHRVSWHDEIEEFHEQPKQENEDSLPTKQASASMGNNVSQYQKRHSMPNVSSSSEESQIAMNNTATTNPTKKKLRELNMGNQNHSFMHALKSMHRRSSMVVPPSSSRAAINFN